MSSEKLVNEFLSFNDNVLKRYFQGKKSEHSLTTSEIAYWITKRFCIDKEMYQTATTIFNEKTSKNKLLLNMLSKSSF
ncbi:hypothetical protein A6283_15865 [Bacillus wiedmannii]|uniref:Uncharacterized protein n=1 Tax=Bacillus cereus group sp. MS39 TaxID=3041344 RepID=A0AAU8FDK3_9BACI|nr:hypothetical protein [Bacillus wiedmannii]EJQ51807.1 hypothetical protein IEI_02339 [Bacillus wiedmannii]OAK16426.1 hypothetical protein A6283_15865 [Bacillus wiedmannii]PHB69184.1 hypothetical protein COE89_22835 [Bacillus wiedmannii]